MARRTRFSIIPKILAGFGYISLLLQWLWLAVIFLPALLENSAVRDFIMPQQSKAPGLEPHIAGTSSPMMLIIAGIVTLIVLAVTVVVLIKLPMVVVRAGKKTVDSSVDAVLPVVTHHKKLPKKKQEKLRLRLGIYAKFFLSLAPFLALFGAYALPLTLPSDIIVLVGAFLCAGTFVWFALEYSTGRLLQTPSKDLL